MPSRSGNPNATALSAPASEQDIRMLLASAGVGVADVAHSRGTYR